MSTNQFNSRIRRKNDKFNTIIKLIPDSLLSLSSKSMSIVNITDDNTELRKNSSITRVYYLQNYKFKAFLLAIIILVNCIQLNESNPVPLMRKSCGRSLSQRIYTICLSYGGICSFPTRSVIRNHQNHRAKRRVVDECCRKPCHDDFIQIYCCDPKQYRVIVD